MRMLATILALEKRAEFRTAPVTRLYATTDQLVAASVVAVLSWAVALVRVNYLRNLLVKARHQVIAAVAAEIYARGHVVGGIA